LENYSSDFWIEFNKEYLSYVYAKLLPMRKYLSDYYKLNNDEFVEYSNSIESELYQGIKKDFSKKVKDISNIVIDLFKKDFWFDKGNQRNWNKIEEDDIDNLFKQVRSKYNDLFENLRYLKIMRSPLKRKYFLI
jgi:hypothetical protein